jgi:hypothetical protein
MYRQCAPGFLLAAALLPAAAVPELNLEAKAPYGDPVARQEQVTGIAQFSYAFRGRDSPPRASSPLSR